MHRNVQAKGHVSLRHAITAATHAHRLVQYKMRIFLNVLFCTVHFYLNDDAKISILF